MVKLLLLSLLYFHIALIANVLHLLSLSSKVKGYRYIEEENSDESDTDLSDADDDEKEEDERMLVEEDNNTDGDSQGSPGPERSGVRDRRRRQDNAAYEQAGEREDYVQHTKD